MNTEKYKKMMIKIIKKSLEGGWFDDYKSLKEIDIYTTYEDDTSFNFKIIVSYMTVDGLLAIKTFHSVKDVLFDKSFAKGFFGDTFVYIQAMMISYGNSSNRQHERLEDKNMSKWQCRIQECILEDDPIIYYYKHI